MYTDTHTHLDIDTHLDKDTYHTHTHTPAHFDGKISTSGIPDVQLVTVANIMACAVSASL